MKGRAVDQSEHAARLRLFGTAWAMAALFHIAGNAPHGQILPHPTPRGITTLLLGLVAIALLMSFRGWVLAVVAGLTIVTAWFEAPQLGNHWLLAAIISGVLLTSLGAARRDVASTACRFVPVAAAATIVAYGFAAFAKLNTGFLDPAASCAGYYASQLVTSWGLPPLASPPLRAAAIAVALAAELSIPIMLTFRRTRPVGVLVGVVFHGLIALDLRQHFWDFSSVLLALFLLFAPEGFAPHTLGVLTRARRLRVAVLWVVVLAAVAMPPSHGARVVVIGVAAILWAATFAGSLLLLLQHLRGGSWWTAVSLPPWPGRAWLAVPVLVALNGLTPYLEIKTAFGFNMYANLRTDRGATNHLLVPRTWPLTEIHRGLVTVLATSDKGLRTYVGSDYALAWDEFRAYLQARPATAVTYARDGVVYAVSRAGDDRGLMEPVPELRRRLLPARAVDLTDPPRCQATWGPAR